MIKKPQELFATMNENFPKIKIRQQAIDPWNIKNTKHVKCTQQKTTLRYIIFKLHKIKALR